MMILLLLMLAQSPEVAVEPLSVSLETVTIIHNEELPVSNPRAAFWSPTSDTLAFVDDGIYLVWPKAGWVPSKIKNDKPSELNWSPDGKKIAYVVNKDSAGHMPMVIVIDVPSGRTLLIINASGKRDLCWRNSNDICLRDEDGGKWRRYRVAEDSTVVAGQPSVWLTASGDMLVPPIRVGDPLGVDIKTFHVPGLDSTGMRSVITHDVCHDGTMVLASAIMDDQRTQILLRKDGTIIDIGSDFQPEEFSPDCRYLVGTAASHDGDTVTESDLWLLELPSHRKAKLTDSAALEFEPSFSHDGTYLVYRMEKNGANFLVLCTVDIKGYA